MKYLLTILLFIYFNANAKTYYVANSGNDSNIGSIIAPFKTIAKANSVAISGDSILLNSGDSWNEKLIVPNSNLYFGRYGTGNKPIVTGFQTLTGLSDSSNIWSATATNAVKNLNTVLINGVIKAKGRYPNTGYLTYTSYSGDSSITGTLSGIPNYTGAEIVVRTVNWMWDVSTITSQTGGTFTFTPKLSYVPKYNGTGYFIQNTVSVLDTTGEWAYNSASKKIYVYSATSPNVQVSTLDTVVFCNKNNVTFDGLQFQGGNVNTMQFSADSNVVVNNCDLNYSGNGISASSYHLTVSNCTINNSQDNAIIQQDRYPNNLAVIFNNIVKNTGVDIGMAQPIQYSRMSGIVVGGAYDSIYNNVVDSSGYIGIESYGSNNFIKNNYVNTFCFSADDGGGIYVISSPSDSLTNIISNIVVNGIGCPQGRLYQFFVGAHGIYLDQDSYKVTVDSNTVYNTNIGGINSGMSSFITITNNNVFSPTSYGIINYFKDTAFIIKNNNVVTPGGFNLYMVDSSLLGSTIDSNYYQILSDNTLTFKFDTAKYDLHNFSLLTGFEVHSHNRPASALASDAPILLYNPTFSDSTFNLTKAYVDFKGNVYSGSIIIHPFKSLILFTQHFSNKLINLKYTKIQ